MIKKQLATPDYFLIAANLIPVYGVWFEGWAATDVFIAYALETLIIGVFTILKLGISTIARGKDNWYANGRVSRVSGLFFIFFFILHYGMFAAVQTSMFSVASGINPRNSNFFYFFLHWYEYIDKETTIMLCSFTLSYAVRDLVPFIMKKEFRTQSMMLVMFQPYGRIFVQQLIVILGSMVLVFNFGKVFIVIFAGVKIYFEVFVSFDKILSKSVEEMSKDR